MTCAPFSSQCVNIKYVLNDFWCFLFWRGTLGSCCMNPRQWEELMGLIWLCFGVPAEGAKAYIIYHACTLTWRRLSQFPWQALKNSSTYSGCIRNLRGRQNFTTPYILLHFNGFWDFLINGQLTGVSGCGQWSSISLLSTSANLEASSTTKWAVLFSCDRVLLPSRFLPWCQLMSDDEQMVCLQLSSCSRTCCARELKLGLAFARYYMSDPWTVIPPCVSVCHPLWLWAQCRAHNTACLPPYPAEHMAVRAFVTSILNSLSFFLLVSRGLLISRFF